MARGRQAAVGGIVLLTVLVAVLVASTGAAQPERQAPPVELSAGAVEGYVEPLAEWRHTDVEVRVGCEEPETPGTRTEVELAIVEVPDGASASLNRTSLSWTSEPGECPADGFPFRANVTASVATDGDAPGFVEQAVALEATVTKDADLPPGEQRTYGPHETTVTYTPGYHHAHAVEAPGPLQAGPDGVASLAVTVQSRANAQARYTVHVEEAPADLGVSVDPESLVLDAGEAGEVEVQIEVERADADATSGRSIVAFNVTGEPTHPDAREGGHEVLAVPVDLDASEEDAVPAQAPSAGLALVAVGLAVAALGAARQSR